MIPERAAYSRFRGDGVIEFEERAVPSAGPGQLLVQVKANALCASDLGAYHHGSEAPRPDLLREFVYGIPELHRDRMANARFVSSAGCNATATILALHPLYSAGLVDPDRTVVEVKAGTSQGGNAPAPGSHHPERSGSIRCYKPVGHRHVAEIRQEVSMFSERLRVHEAEETELLSQSLYTDLGGSSD